MQEWEERWSLGLTPWDRGECHPLFEMSAPWVASKTDIAHRVWVPGCGHGHEAAWAASLGADVKGVDGAQGAVASAIKLYAGKDLEFSQENALLICDEEREVYHTILDRAFLCALPPEQRSQYFDCCFERLRPGGVWVSVAFEKVRVEQGPPFAVSIHEILTLWGGRLNLVESRSSDQFCSDKIELETFQIWQKPFAKT